MESTNSHCIQALMDMAGMAVRKAVADDTDLVMDQGKMGRQNQQQEDLASRQGVHHIQDQGRHRAVVQRGMVHFGAHLTHQHAYHMVAAADTNHSPADSHLGTSFAG